MLKWQIYKLQLLHYPVLGEIGTTTPQELGAHVLLITQEVERDGENIKRNVAVNQNELNNSLELLDVLAEKFHSKSVSSVGLDTSPSSCMDQMALP